MSAFQERRAFARQEAMRRARFEYGLHPYEPDHPCRIEKSSVEYKCGCGFQTHSAGEIFDHVHNEHDNEKQMELELIEAETVKFNGGVA